MKHSVSELKLKNGAQGLLVDVPGATVMSYLIQYRAGDQYVKSKEIYETAHIMEHMAFGANAKFENGNDFSAEFERNGAYHNAYTADVSMVYISDCAEIEWDRILDLQKIAITTPRFLENELKAEAGNVDEELTGYLSNNPRILWERIMRAGGDSSLLNKERLQLINNVTVEDIKEHHKRTHTLRNMRFVIAGPLSGKKRRIADLMESWRLPKGERLPVRGDNMHANKPVVIKRKDVPNLIFGIGLFINERLSDSELDAMGALNHILTGTLHSRILGQARTKGLTYGMWSDTTAYEHMSEWAFGGQCNVTKASSLFDIVATELKRVLDGKLSAKEVEQAIAYGLGKHQMACQTVGQVAHWYSGRYFFDGHVDNFDYRPRAIRAVTAEKIAATANKFITAENLVLGGLGNSDQELLEKLENKLKRALFEKSK